MDHITLKVFLILVPSCCLCASSFALSSTLTSSNCSMATNCFWNSLGRKELLMAFKLHNVILKSIDERYNNFNVFKNLNISRIWKNYYFIFKSPSWTDSFNESVHTAASITLQVFQIKNLEVIVFLSDIIISYIHSDVCGMLYT